MKSSFIVLFASSLFKLLESASIEKIVKSCDEFSEILSPIIKNNLEVEKESFVEDDTLSNDSFPLAFDISKDEGLSYPNAIINNSSNDPSLPNYITSLQNFAPESDQDLLLSLNDAFHLKDYPKIIELIERISNWKLTCKNTTFSVLSLLSRHARPQCLGKLYHQSALKMFAPFIAGRNFKLSSGYFYALALFLPSIQRRVINQLIHEIPHLRGVLLLVAIYFKLDKQSVSLILKSGAVINFESTDEASPLTSFPSFIQKSSQKDHQIPVTKRFFMNFFDSAHPYFGEWERRVSSDPEDLFLYGMLSGGVPEECGALQVAFHNYPPKIVKALIELSPNRDMTNYHLAHLLALSPEKQKNFPNIESLVNLQLVFDRLKNGFSDIVALACLNKLPVSDQVSLISEFISKTNIFEYFHLNNPRTITTAISKEFSEETGIYELPSNPAHVFFLAACKADLADEAFVKIIDACRNIQTRSFYISCKLALNWAKSKNPDF